MLWLKAFHIIAVITWFAGLFYLPRLYVYHADARDSISIGRFKIMERRLFALMTIGAVAGVALGAAMLVAALYISRCRGCGSSSCWFSLSLPITATATSSCAISRAMPTRAQPAGTARSTKSPRCC
jgi:uncharacterized integral membrane protein (TIGR00701 family)